MGHAMIVFYHGVSLPILYIIFFVHIAIFLIIEKAMMLRFYRKMDAKTAWIRQFIIHTLFLTLLFH